MSWSFLVNWRPLTHRLVRRPTGGSHAAHGLERRRPRLQHRPLRAMSARVLSNHCRFSCFALMQAGTPAFQSVGGTTALEVNRDGLAKDVWIKRSALHF